MQKWLDLRTLKYFLGVRNDISEILSSLDAFIFSSKGDSFGISLIEAMISKVPTISSDIGALKEVTDDGKYSLLFKTGDEKDLAEKILFLINNNVYRTKLKNDAYQWVLSEYTTEKYNMNLEKIYFDLISKKDINA